MGRKAVIGSVATVLSVALPVGAYIGLSYATYYYLARRSARLDAWLLTGVAAVIMASLFGARLGVDMAKCLVILILAPAIIVVGYEGHGYSDEGG
jgi:hypothetical protein